MSSVDWCIARQRPTYCGQTPSVVHGGDMWGSRSIYKMPADGDSYQARTSELVSHRQANCALILAGLQISAGAFWHGAKRPQDLTKPLVWYWRTRLGGLCVFLNRGSSLWFPFKSNPRRFPPKRTHPLFQRSKGSFQQHTPHTPRAARSASGETSPHD